MEATNACLRASIALNNLGITMLERSAYGDARETLRDAVVATHMATQAGLESDPKLYPLLQEKLRRATQRLANENAKIYPTQRLLAVFSSTECVQKVMQQMQICDSASTDVVLRVDTNDNEDIESIEVSQLSTIFLYNLAVTNLLLSRSFRGMKAERLRSGARQILSEKVSTLVSFQQHDDYRWNVFFGMFLQYTLVVASFEDREIEKVKDHTQRFVLLRAEASRLCEIDGNPHAAAAA